MRQPYYNIRYQRGEILHIGSLIIELHLLAEVIKDVLLPVLVVDLGTVELDLGLEVVVLGRRGATFLCL